MINNHECISQAGEGREEHGGDGWRAGRRRPPLQCSAGPRRVSAASVKPRARSLTRSARRPVVPYSSRVWLFINTFAEADGAALARNYHVEAARRPTAPPPAALHCPDSRPAAAAAASPQIITGKA